MSELNFTTTALLFPAIPLLMVMFGNRFTALSGLIRRLHDEYSANPRDEAHRERIVSQIGLLTMRVRLLRNTQLTSCMGFFFNMLTIFALYAGQRHLAQGIFALALLSMIGAILLYMRDVFISAKSLDIHLSNLKKN